MSILVTGGCGFIGTNFIKRVLQFYPDYKIVNVDKLTYAANKYNHVEYDCDPRYILIPIDIGSTEVASVIQNHKPTAIVNFAAESHVDNSIKDSSPFFETNVMGTLSLLETCRRNITWDYRFIHVSTDEVYGSLNPGDPEFTEETPYDPRSPYSASKAASDHIVSAYHHTHGMPTIITNCSNNYGPYQHPEKFIPVVISKALNDEKIPVYGTGQNIRDWLYVIDHCDALINVLWKGKIGEKYCIGGNTQIDNLSLARKILKIMGKSESLIEFVEDRKGHDFRYAIDTMKIDRDLGWQPVTSLNKGLKLTVDWYLNNNKWLKQAKKA